MKNNEIKFGDICFAENHRTVARSIGNGLCMWVSAMSNDLMISKIGMAFPHPPENTVVPDYREAEAAAAALRYAGMYSDPNNE